MSKYPRQENGWFDFSKWLWGWGTFAGLLMLAIGFSAGWYVGYYQGIGSNASTVKSQTSSARNAGSNGESETVETVETDTSPFERVITEKDLRGASNSARTAPVPDTEQSDATSPPTESNDSNKTSNNRPANQTDQRNVIQPDIDSSTGNHQENDRETEAIASSGSYYTVQVFSSKSRERAETMQKTVRESGREASLTTTTINGEEWYRVRVGRFSTKERAESDADSLVKQGLIEDYWISQLSPNS